MPGPLERASERADRVSATTLPYLERKGTNFVSGAMAGQQFVQNIEESQRRDALAESRMAAEEGRRRQYDANIDMMHKEMDIRQRQLGIDLQGAEIQKRMADLDMEAGKEELDVRRSRRVDHLPNGMLRINNGRGGTIEVRADSPSGQNAIRVDEMRENRGYVRRGGQGDMRELTRTLEDQRDYWSKMPLGELTPDQAAEREAVLRAINQQLLEIGGLGGVAQQARTQQAYGQYQESVYGQTASGLIESIRDSAGAKGLQFDRERLEQWVSYYIASEGEGQATYRLSNLLGDIDAGNFEEAERIFGR